MSPYLETLRKISKSHFVPFSRIKMQFRTDACVFLRNEIPKYSIYKGAGILTIWRV